MIPPAVAAERFLAAGALGLFLGLCYSFLRPLRQRHVHWADFFFLPALFWVWLYLGFAICRGDLRLGYYLGTFLGWLAWELTLGKLLRPFFQGIWQILFPILGFPRFLAKKFFEKTGHFVKFLLASGKKAVIMVTMKESAAGKDTEGSRAMAKKKSFFSRFKLVYKRSSRVTKIVVLLAVVLTTVTLLTLSAYISDANARAEEARREAAELEQEKEDLKDKIQDQGSLDGIKDAAGDDGLVDPDTVIISPKD